MVFVVCVVFLHPAWSETAQGKEGKGTQRKNIVLILADDLEADYKQNHKEFMPTLNQYFAEGGFALFHSSTGFDDPIIGPYP